MYMGYLEAAFCPRSEFKRGLPKRIHEAEIEKEELYTAMFALTTDSPDQQAAKLPIRVLQPPLHDDRTGLAYVRADFLDKDLKPTLRRTMELGGGIWLPDSEAKICIQGLDIEAAYLAEYGDGLGGFSDVFEVVEQLGSFTLDDLVKLGA